MTKIGKRVKASWAIVIALAFFATVLAIGQPSAAAQPLMCGGKTVTIDMNSNGGSGIGTTGDDVILGTPGDDVIRTGAGNDTICAGAGRDRVYAGSGDDHVLGGDGIDYIWGGEGSDTLEGNGGSDRLRGGDDVDYLRGGSGADRMWGGPGNDDMRGQGGQDQMWGEDGNDTMQGNWQSDLIRGGDGDDTIGGAEGKDNLFGDSGADTITGGNNTDDLYGGPGPDTLSGGNGADTLNGGTDIDFLNGGPHTDLCNRGSGDTMLSCQGRDWEASDSWVLVEADIDGTVTNYETISSARGLIEIDASTRFFEGSSGCNSGGGTVDIVGLSFSADVGAITDAACIGALGDIDGLIFVVMNEMSNVSVTASSLVLQNTDGTRSMTFDRLPAKQAGISPLGDWILVEGYRDPCYNVVSGPGPACLAAVLDLGPVNPGDITLTIQPTTVSGSGGCNSYQANRNLAVPFGLTDFLTTLIGCQADVANAEQRFYDALGDVTNVEVSATTLRLSGNGVILDFVR